MATAGEAAGIEAQGPVELIGASRAVHSRTAAIDTFPPGLDYSDSVLLLGRLKPRTAPESRRVVHVFPLAPHLLQDAVLTTRCGETLPAADMEWLPGLTGMPCEHCVLPSLIERIRG